MVLSVRILRITFRFHKANQLYEVILKLIKSKIEKHSYLNFLMQNRLRSIDVIGFCALWICKLLNFACATEHCQFPFPVRTVTKVRHVRPSISRYRLVDQNDTSMKTHCIWWWVFPLHSYTIKPCYINFVNSFLKSW